MPATTFAVIGDGTVQTDNPLIGLPGCRAQADRLTSAHILRQPAGNGIRILNIRHQEKEVRLRAIPLDSGKQEFNSQPTALRLQVMCLVHYDKGKRSLNLFVADHQ